MKRSSALAAVALVAAALAPAAARAQPERYFEHDGYRREGFFLGLLTQGGAFLSTSCCDIGGKRGAGGGGIRVGTVATERLLWVLQAESAAVPIEDAEGNTQLNSHATLTIGAIYYPLQTLWLQAGVGFATYRIRETVEETQVVDLERNGFAFSSSIGFDFFRSPDVWTFGLARQDLALSFEIRVGGGLYPAGTPAIGATEQNTGGILQITSGLGLQWY